MPASKFTIEEKLSKTPSHRHTLGLYPERISGTSFTAKRAVNKQTFLYRILPSTAQSGWTRVPDHPLNHRLHSQLNFVPDQLIWPPLRVRKDKTFLAGLQLIGGAGDPTTKNGMAYYFFTCRISMDPKQAFYSADGDLLIVPQIGVLYMQTEMGDIRVRPREICVIPRGIQFCVAIPQGTGPSRGHVIETCSGHFDVPELGPIGSLGLANVRDFAIPRAKYVDSEGLSEVLAKFGGQIHRTELRGSPFNAVAWHGTYYPFKYDLGKFMPMGSTLYDHQDPSIYVVLSCPSDKPDHAAVDFLVLGPRWMVIEDTFQIPYFHRNTMSEFSSVISGGFDLSRVPPQLYGISGLHNILSPHGLSAAETENAIKKALRPERVPDDTMAFLIKSC